MYTTTGTQIVLNKALVKTYFVYTTTKRKILL